MSDGFRKTLIAEGPFAAHAGNVSLYGQFVGDWTFDAKRWLADGTVLSGVGEIHFEWVLEGRAVQDTWILPARGIETPPSLGGWTFYGTTLRLYDPALDAWHILWSDARNAYLSRQLGRREGDRIVQDAVDTTDGLVRWSFNTITPCSFRWLAERSRDAGKTWLTEVEFLARRTAV